jgi:hypothetical protein
MDIGGAAEALQVCRGLILLQLRRFQVLQIHNCSAVGSGALASPFKPDGTVGKGLHGPGSARVLLFVRRTISSIRAGRYFVVLLWKSTG